MGQQLGWIGERGEGGEVCDGAGAGGEMRGEDCGRRE